MADSEEAREFFKSLPVIKELDIHVNDIPFGPPASAALMVATSAGVVGGMGLPMVAVDLALVAEFLYQRPELDRECRQFVEDSNPFKDDPQRM